MSIKYLFKSLYNRKKIIILLVLQTIVYIFFVMNIFSIVMFKSNFIKNYKENFPIESGAYVKNITDGDSIEKNRNKAWQFIKYIETNKYIKSYRLCLKDGLNTKEFNIDTSKFKEEYIYTEDNFKDNIPWYRFNYGYYSEIEKYIDGNGFRMEDFQKDNEFIPVILGETYKKNYKKGDIIASNNLKFKVVGFLKKTILIMDIDPIINVQSSEKCFISPLTKSFLNEPYNLSMSMPHMIFTFSNNVNNSIIIKQIENKSKELGINLKLNNFYDDLNKFLPDLDSQILFEAIRVLIFTILSLGMFTLSFVYLISNRKKEVGVLYSIGASKKDIICMFCFDMIFIIAVAYLISIPIYLYMGKLVFFFFMNSFNILNLGVPFIIILLISFISLILPINNIIKLKPNELIGGK
ncbi:FtsX-like permease family protein [Clostridium sp. L74]|uniref:FtsX-like permease family protein n=1 Tax=Clostridium sp. L74 TaxID=1560217 RepID=UPI0006ABDDB5|nr:FtsX-like permease family protein [Clostridium sp. L74]KOR25401.1 hypothetical protein ND00_17070 [Clostridium sp. L74]